MVKEAWVRYLGYFRFKGSEIGGPIDFRAIRHAEDEIPEPEMGLKKIMKLRNEVGRILIQKSGGYIFGFLSIFGL